MAIKSALSFAILGTHVEDPIQRLQIIKNSSTEGKAIQNNLSSQAAQNYAMIGGVPILLAQLLRLSEVEPESPPRDQQVLGEGEVPRRPHGAGGSLGAGPSRSARAAPAAANGTRPSSSLRSRRPRFHQRTAAREKGSVAVTVFEKERGQEAGRRQRIAPRAASRLLRVRRPDLAPGVASGNPAHRRKDSAAAR